MYAKKPKRAFRCYIISMKKSIKFISIFGLALISFILGVYVADNHVVWGHVDLLSKKENKIVKLTRSMSFKETDGTIITFEKGTVLNWEGFYDDQNFMSKRYLIEGFDSFEVLRNAGMAREFLYQDINPSKN